ncbi:amino acid aminotransferase [Rufibacter immobilis]|uniref:branched-chain-amino-acid transaminase n=1 Tax=Rufibacter immobilis TaxID=1348778 RepID=A0A3M9MPP0_9BACT|nr:aminotransferase class IV [Rufibacter immobilis]RNI27195.1 amino acid aminotransferase [Rufibacter immobilis]
MLSDHKNYAYLHGEFVPLENAYLHVSDLSIQRGYGIFDFFKVQEEAPLFLEHYISRFFQSAQLMGLPVPLSEEQLKATLAELLQKNKLPNSGVKMILTGGYSANGYDPAAPNLLITQQALTLPTQEQVARGIKIITHEYVRELPLAKTINYSMGIRLLQEVKARQADDVLYHHGGVVTEFPRSNFFLLTQDNVLVTPAQEVLLGVTRRNVLELARQQYQVQERTVTLEDIAQAREAFMTSTTKRVLPIVEVDGKPVNDGKPGPVTLQLLEQLLELEQKQFID